MYVCLCNPFTDNDVNRHLSTTVGKTSVKEVYAACSGGEKMNCGNCACDLKQMVDGHNNTKTISQISQDMEKAADQVTLPQHEHV